MADENDRGMPPLHNQMRRLSFDPTINLGHVLTMAAMAATVVLGWSQLSTRLEYVERQMVTMTTVVERSVRADTRLEGIERRLDRVEGDRP